MNKYWVILGSVFASVALFAWVYINQDPCDNVVPDLAESERYVGVWILQSDEENRIVANRLVPGCEELRIDLIRHHDSGGARIQFSIENQSVEADLFVLELATFSGTLKFAIRPWFFAENVRLEGAGMDIGRCLLTSSYDKLHLWLDEGNEYPEPVVFRRG